MRIQIIPAPQHRPDYYSHVYDGYRALQLLNDAGQARAGVASEAGTCA
jgi:hypothetical protein